MTPPPHAGSKAERLSRRLRSASAAPAHRFYNSPVSGGVQTASPRSGAARGVGLIVVGSSLGGLAATGELLRHLPADLPAPVVVVQHRASRPDVLAALLQRQTTLRVVDATAGLRPKAGTVYVAPPDGQLTFDARGRFCHDPAARSLLDPLLVSAAAVHGERLIAVILTGRLDDGARGAIAVKAAGGRVFAQDRASSVAFAMPAAAIATGCVDFVLPPPAISSSLITLTMLPAAAELFSVDRPAWATTAA